MRTASKRLILFHSAAVTVLCTALLILSASYAFQYVEKTRCASRVRVINKAACDWAKTHEGLLPPNVLSLSNAVGSPRILICPSDHSRDPATNWETFSPANNSYRLGSGLPVYGPIMFMSVVCCDIHQLYAYADGSVVSYSRAIKDPRLFFGLIIVTLGWGLLLIACKRGEGVSIGGLDAAELKLRVVRSRDHYIAERRRASGLWYRRMLLATARKAVQTLSYFRHSRS